MAGTFTTAGNRPDTLGGFFAGVVTANFYLAQTVVLYPCRLGAVKVYAEVAGTGSGDTVVDLQRNGVSVWTSSANRPTLAATSTGEFANTAPNARALQEGDRLAFVVSSVSTTGHARVFAAASLEKP